MTKIKRTKNVGKRQLVKRRKILKTIGYIVIIVCTVLILRTPMAQDVILQVAPVKIVAEFVAGLIYTSLLTIPISIALLSVLSENSNIYFIAAVGGLGAVVGDFLIMNVFSKVSQSIHIDHGKKPRFSVYAPPWLLRVLGVLCLALPVPDEIAMAFLGISKIDIRTFILIVYPAKAFGIYMVTLGAGNLLG